MLMRSKWLRTFSKSRCEERILIYWAQDEIVKGNHGRWKMFISQNCTAETQEAMVLCILRWSPEKRFKLVFLYDIQRLFIKMIQCFFVMISFLFYSSIYTCQENLRTQWFLIGWAWRFYFPIFKESSYLEVFTEAVMPYTGMNPSLPWWICREVPVIFRSL